MNTTDTWSLLYGAMVEGLGLSTKTFQLVYPFTSWNWPATGPGYVAAAQYDFCATMPQWSGVGRYVSSGTRYNDSYGNFLSILVPLGVDPALQHKITLQQGAVQLAKNDYDTVYSQATIAYHEAVGGDNDPTFTDWLGTTEGSGWAALLDQKYKAYEGSVAVLEELVDQTKDKALQAAMAAYHDQQTYVKYQDPGLSGFPRVPGWRVAQTPSEWLQEVWAGKIPGADFSIDMKQQPYDFGSTWAGSSQPVTSALFAVSEEGVWRPLSPEEEQDVATVSVSLAAWSTLAIDPYDWYSTSIVTGRAEGPFLAGYSGYPKNSDVYLWGKGGAMELRKTGMMVAYKPVFTITFKESARLLRKVELVTGFRVGPLVQEYANAQMSSGARLTLESDPSLTMAEVPQIFGVQIEEPPGAVASRLAAERIHQTLKTEKEMSWLSRYPQRRQ